jgi:light-regulated signal transduction histidine kinase (bacteriophytochrome)
LIAQGDTRLLQVVLENLLNNAWKFTAKRPQAKIDFGLLSSETVENISTYTYFVRDDGVGFDMAYIDKLFSPFQRLHSVTEFPGNGIGLATVQRIVHRHGGQLRAEGALGQGATFYFTLSTGESAL